MLEVAGTKEIPTDELEVATDLCEGLQAFYTKHAQLSGRPLFITGESYAGKYVPAIGHFIVQAQASADSRPLSAIRDFPRRAQMLGPPRFHLAGLVIGNGLTDPVTQVRLWGLCSGAAWLAWKHAVRRLGSSICRSANDNAGTERSTEEYLPFASAIWCTCCVLSLRSVLAVMAEFAAASLWHLYQC